VFIDPFVRYVHLRSFGDDQRKTNSFRARALALQERRPDARKDEFPNRASLRSGLLFEFPIERDRDIYCGSDSFRLHSHIIPRMP